MNDFDAIQAFRAGERYIGQPLVCCLCCGEAEGNYTDDECDEPVCDACIEKAS